MPTKSCMVLLLSVQIDDISNAMYVLVLPASSRVFNGEAISVQGLPWLKPNCIY